MGRAGGGAGGPWAIAARDALAALRSAAEPGPGGDRPLIAAVVGGFALAMAARRGLAAAPLVASFVTMGEDAPSEAWLDRARRAAPDEGGGGDALGAAYEAILEGRRQGGRHYTPPWLADRIARAALAPLSAPAVPRVLDPAVGSGACLLAALRFTAARLAGGGLPGAHHRRRAAVGLAGSDVDALAAQVARWALWLEVGDPTAGPGELGHLVVGDGLSPEETGLTGPFDAAIGNPPWVSYVGRAAQPLEPTAREALARRFESFRGYRNLQALFLESAADRLRPGGRLSFLVPSSMSEQLGYGPSRRALARRVDLDAELGDVGEDAFAGVFQPCMIVAGTRRDAAARETGDDRPWPVARADLDEADRALLARLAALRPLPAATFGERGVQTSGQDAEDLARVPDARRTLALRTGSDVAQFRLGPASRFADPARLGGRFRAMDWREVAFVVRQTAAFPIAARSDGAAFRNTLLGGFEVEGLSADLLVAWLGSTPIRWLHHQRFRDARQGMPQVKVGHLRSLPAPPAGEVRARLERIGAALSSANAGVPAGAQHDLDEAAADALGLSSADRARIAAWWDRLRARPTSRPRAPESG